MEMPAGSLPDKIMVTYLSPTVFIAHALSEALYWYRHTINACMGSLCGTYYYLQTPLFSDESITGIRGHTQKTHTVSKLKLEKRSTLLSQLTRHEHAPVLGRARTWNKARKMYYPRGGIGIVDQAWLPVLFRFLFRFVPCFTYTPTCTYYTV